MKNEIKSVNTGLKTRYMYMYNYGVKVFLYDLHVHVCHHLSMNFGFQTQQQNLIIMACRVIPMIVFHWVLFLKFYKNL